MERLIKQLFVVFIVLAAALHSFEAHAQQQVLEIEVENITLKALFELIQEKCKVSFSYNPNRLPLKEKVTYQAKKSLEEILKDLEDKFSIEFSFIEQQIIIKPKRKANDKKASTYTISGYIKDNKNGEALIGATVSIPALNIGTSSNVYGFFSLTVPDQEHEVKISFIGYSEVIKTYSQGSSEEVIELVETIPMLEEVVISSGPNPEIGEIQLSKSILRPEAVSEMPALFGEMDVVKSMEFMPGIKAHSDGSTFFYVRGGNRDQNLIMLDDAPIFNSSHMLGVFSTIIPDAVNSIDIYTGDMPASMGGRLSSVVDIRTKKGNDKHTQVWGNVGLISTKLGIEGPIRKEQSSFLVSGRLSRIKWIFENENQDLKQLYFYDLTTKLNFKLSNRDQIYFSAYSGRDNYFVDNSGIEWANLAGTFRWNHIVNDRLFLNTTIAASSYDYFLHTDVENNTKWKSHIANLNIKGDFTYFVNPDNVVTFGLAINGHNFNPGNLTTDDPDVQPPLVSIKNAFESVIYGQQEVKLGEHWGLKYGLRLTSWTNQGASFEFQFDENKNVTDTLFYEAGEDYNQYGNAEPRLGISYFINDQSAIKLSYARTVQNLHLITNSISPFTSLEVWLPSSINIKPQIANQVALGYQHSWPKSGLAFSTEVYAKKMFNQIDYQPHAETLLNPLLENELLFGDAEAYGTEFTLKKELGRLRGWAGYTYSRATRTFDEIDNGEAFNSFYDRPHEVNLVLGYDLTERIKLGANWIYYTGSPYSAPIGFYKFNDQETPVYGKKNNARLPGYHRLDFSATFTLNKPENTKFHHDLSLSFYNLYGRKNTLFINYNKTEVGENEFKIPSNLLEDNRVTSQYYLFRFTPSLTYNFRIL
ncbi:TonB-dependent receptor [Fulvivirga lutimaris]|uniref:TonB-dependent receptor n=1 Tax=Fulvivirga lutimaris TaxID=1819566 RepID=UPI001625EDDE|nr:TonB-dependent receptor [Fulvivirga lutimaris]